MSKQYEYDGAGNRELIGEWHTHPLAHNLKQARRHEEQALAAYIEATGEVKEFWLKQANWCYGRVEYWRRAWEVHQMRESDYMLRHRSDSHE